MENKVLSGRNEVFRVADHDFAKLSLIPTTILINEVPSTVDGSWYRGTPYLGVKVTALQSSTALRNAREIAGCLILRYGSKEVFPPVLIVYSDGGPEHRTTFLSVKIAMIALSKFLNLDMLLLARTAPGHSWTNPAEKINCILNLGLYGIGAMRTESSDVEFEASLKRCNGLEDIRKLLSRDEQRNHDLLEETCHQCIRLIKSNFSRLTLKEESFKVFDPAENEDVNELFRMCNLDETLSPMDNMNKLSQRPLLKKFLDHCCKERTYFLSILKCGNDTYSICSKPKQNEEYFCRLKHLPDPMPGDGKHYKPFEQVFGENTVQEHMPSLQKIKLSHIIFPLIRFNSIAEIPHCF